MRRPPWLLLGLLALGLWGWYSTTTQAMLAAEAPYGVFPDQAGQARAWKVPGTTYYGSTPGVVASPQALTNCPVCSSSGSFWTCICT